MASDIPAPSSMPVIDVGPLVSGRGDVEGVARRLDRACRDVGFFTVVGHGLDPALLTDLEAASRTFFALPEARKAEIAMVHGGAAWRGWFPVGGELTAGVPDHKEGVYLGTELAVDDPRVRAGRLLHGPNLWPAEPAGLRPAVEAWMAAVTALGHTLLGGLAVGLGLEADWFARHLTAEPTVLFRIFRYPPVDPPVDGWGVAEHTDYGLLTILAQDRHGGLEVRGPGGWLDVPPHPDALVCNLGDMLDRMTGGRYRSTPHRVRPSIGVDRLSFPLFLDPGWDVDVRRLPLAGEAPPDDAAGRWDGTSLAALDGTYGQYLEAKVAKVFPHLAG